MSWFEIEISSFFFLFFSISFVFIISHLHFWLSVIIRATMRQNNALPPSPFLRELFNECLPRINPPIFSQKKRSFEK